MPERLSISSLIERQPLNEADASSSHELPEVIRLSRNLWDGVAKRFGEMLSDMLEAPISVSISLRMATEHALREEFPKPGILLPVSKPVEDGFFLLPGEGAKQLANLLLRASGEAGDDEDVASSQDGLLVEEIIGALSELTVTAFSMPVAEEGRLVPLIDWPLQAPPHADRLVTNIHISLPNDQTALLLLVFGDDRVAAFEALLDQSGSQVQPQVLPIMLTGVLSRWFADEDEISSIQPGHRLLVPGGSLTSISVEADGSDQSVKIAQAELGTTRGRHALKVTAKSF